MLRKFLFALLPFMGFLLQMAAQPFDSVMKKGESYQKSWESLKNHPNPEWFSDAKFGIYFHWGVYSVPAFGGEWYSRWMYVDTLVWGADYYKHHQETYGSPAAFGYKDFIPSFKAEFFNADEWVDLFVKSGAKFVGPVAEHADGFSMWDSQLTSWDAKEMGPKRDIVGELAVAIRKRNLKFITTFHHQWLWGWYPTWDGNSGTTHLEDSGLYGPPSGPDAFIYAQPQPAPTLAFCQMWKNKMLEVIDKYQPDLIYLDSRCGIIPDSIRQAFLTHYYNRALQWKKEVTMTYKVTDFPVGTGILDLERGQMATTKSFPWLVDTSIDALTWCDVAHPVYKSTDRLIDYLIDVVSKNGQLLLNVTPRANGTIPEGVKTRLMEIGQWLKVNGEAIYGTRPWAVAFGEGPTMVPEGDFNDNGIKDFTDLDIRFTTRGDTLYALPMAIPETRSVLITTLTSKACRIQSIEMVGTNESLKFRQTSAGTRIELPAVVLSKFACALRILGYKANELK